MLLERTTTSLLNGTLRNSTRQLQVDLQDAQTEMSTGRFADAGLVLGANVSRNLDWRSEIERLTTSLKRNEMQSERAKVTQAGIESIKSQSTYLMNTIVGARSAANGGQLARTAGENALKGMMEVLSTTYSGQYIFSGNTPDTSPLAEYVVARPKVPSMLPSRPSSVSPRQTRRPPPSHLPRCRPSCRDATMIFSRSAVDYRLADIVLREPDGPDRWHDHRQHRCQCQ